MSRRHFPLPCLNLCSFYGGLLPVTLFTALMALVVFQIRIFAFHSFSIMSWYLNCNYAWPHKVATRCNVITQEAIHLSVKDRVGYINIIPSWFNGIMFNSWPVIVASTRRNNYGMESLHRSSSIVWNSVQTLGVEKFTKSHYCWREFFIPEYTVCRL